MASLSLALRSKLTQPQTRSLPKFFSLVSVQTNKYLRYIDEEGEKHGCLQFSGEDFFSPFVKFEAELADCEGGLVNLKCCYNNKYWVRSNSKLIAVAANEANEDLSKTSCTLFRPVYVSQDANIIRIVHVQSEYYTCLSETFASCVNAASNVPDRSSGDLYTVINRDLLAVLPQYVSFKGSNDSYLQAVWVQNHEYMQFSGSDKAEVRAGFEIYSHVNGSIRVRSLHYNKFWRRSPNWIWADQTLTGNNSDCYFLPYQVNGNNVIALRNMGNELFCTSLTLDKKTNCLNANSSTMVKSSELKVEECVLRREIYNINYRLDEARIYNESSIGVISNSVTNNTNIDENSAKVTLSYTETKTSTWTATISVKLGVTTTISGGIPLIVKGQIEVSTEFSGTYEWGETKTETIQATTEYETSVPAIIKVIITLVADKGSCDVPFTYTQRDTLYDGRQITTNLRDGLYTGSNYFNFDYQVDRESLN